jgi:hypothetical protein
MSPTLVLTHLVKRLHFQFKSIFSIFFMTVTTPKLPSERKFGLLFFIIFSIIAAVNYYRHHNLTIVMAWLIGAVLFLVLALVAPNVLRPLNKAWFQLGLFMGKIVNPIVMAVLFFILITPVAIITRLGGRDVLKLKKSKQASYWVDRNPLGPDAESFKNQF